MKSKNIEYTFGDFLNINFILSPSINHTGDTIAFLNNESGSYQIYSISTDGSNLKQLTNHSEKITFAKFSPVRNEM
jgi:Tol biopolymer transport system component